MGSRACLPANSLSLFSATDSKTSHLHWFLHLPAWSHEILLCVCVCVHVRACTHGGWNYDLKEKAVEESNSRVPAPIKDKEMSQWGRHSYRTRFHQTVMSPRLKSSEHKTKPCSAVTNLLNTHTHLNVVNAWTAGLRSHNPRALNVIKVEYKLTLRDPFCYLWRNSLTLCRCAFDFRWRSFWIYSRLMLRPLRLHLLYDLRKMRRLYLWKVCVLGHGCWTSLAADLMGGTKCSNVQPIQQFTK